MVVAVRVGVVVVVNVGVVVRPKFKMEIQFIKVAKPYAKTVKRTTFLGQISNLERILEI
jgi:hypothetical protein